MTRPSHQIEQAVDAAGDVLKALKRLADELEKLSDSDNPFIGKDEVPSLDWYRFVTDHAIKQIDGMWGGVASLYEAAAWLEEEERAEQCQK